MSMARQARDSGAAVAAAAAVRRSGAEVEGLGGVAGKEERARSRCLYTITRKNQAPLLTEQS